MRKKRVYKKFHEPDAKHERVDLGRFISCVMQDGKKTTAEKIVYAALDLVKKETKEEPLTVFERALENVKPQIEVVSRRVGGANYQVPQEVRPERRFTLAVRWIIAAARSGKGQPMAKKLAAELVAASKNEGAAIKKKQDMHRMAEANRAFAHFARSRTRTRPV
jgi:small subunit ribosomal protein S7